MRFRAIAVAAERSNAIGVVEVECTPHGLALGYLGAGAFSDGYAPGALTTGTRVTVPYGQILDARVEGEQLYLAVDPTLTPLSQLTLTTFSTGDGVHLRERHRQRLIVRVGAVATALLAILLPALSLPRLVPRAGAGLALAVGVLGALAVLVIGLAADRHVALGGRDGEAALGAFAAELARYLPNLTRAAGPPPPKTKPLRLPDFERLLPRTAFAVIATLTAGALALVLTAHRVLTVGESARAPVAQHRTAEPDVAPAPGPTGPAPAVAARAAPSASTPSPALTTPTGDTASTAGPCRCERADSLLWARPLPALSSLVLRRRLEHHGAHDELALDIAAVNSGDRPLEDVTFMVQFFERDPPPSNRRYPVSSRALYFEGPLAPGQAIKWSVQARGREVDIQGAPPATLGPEGQGAAPTNLIAGLLDANHRPVRLYGAMLLGYLGDPRAREAAEKLHEALRDDEAPYLSRLLAALGEVRACNLRVSGDLATLCLYNASGEARSGLGVRLRGLDAMVDPSEPTGQPPTVVFEHVWHVPGELAPERGLVTSVRLDAAEPAALEAAADRYDLLRD